MGYGSRALQLLQMYFEGRFPCLEEKVLETSQEIRTVSSEVSIFWLSSLFLEDSSQEHLELSSGLGCLSTSRFPPVLEKLLLLQLPLELRTSDQHYQHHLETYLKNAGF